jgi:hypothetical protein
MICQPKNEPAATQRAGGARSFFSPAKRQPAGKRSPATIYGGLRLAGTLVLLHPSWFLSIPLIAVSCDLLHGSTFKLRTESDDL